eukprot:gene13572-biopygen544
MSSGKPLKGRKELRRDECTRYADLIGRSMETELAKISARGVWGDPEVSSPDGAILMSGKWVHTWKKPPDEVEPGGEPIVKSRFCMKGFQDPRRGLRTDSATASATAQRAVLAHAAINGNVVVSMDIECAFLNGDAYDDSEMERPLYAKIPQAIHGGHKYRRLYKSLYGLTDAPRRWRITLTRKLRSIGWCPLVSDPSILIKVSKSSATSEREAPKFSERMDESWSETVQRELASYPNGSNGTVLGVLTIHVDDLKLSISPKDVDQEIASIRRLFPLGKEKRLLAAGQATDHVGMRISKCANGYGLDQVAYADSLEPLNLEGIIDDEKPYNDVESFARLTGQLLWLANSRPDLAFRVSRLASKVSNPSGADARGANAAVRVAQSAPLLLRFPALK